MPRRSKVKDTSLINAAKRGDLWMIKAIYLSCLLFKLGIDVRWMLQVKAENKEDIYAAMDRVMIWLKEDESESRDIRLNNQ